MQFLDLSKFSTLKELQEYANKQFQTILMLKTALNDMENKAVHLEKLLEQSKVEPLIIQDKEVEICRIEINRLYQTSIGRPLEDKEIRNLETLVKTLAVAKGKTISEEKDKKEKKDHKALPVGRLIELAKQIKEE